MPSMLTMTLPSRNGVKFTAYKDAKDRLWKVLVFAPAEGADTLGPVHGSGHFPEFRHFSYVSNQIHLNQIGCGREWDSY